MCKKIIIFIVAICVLSLSSIFRDIFSPIFSPWLIGVWGGMIYVTLMRYVFYGNKEHRKIKGMEEQYNKLEKHVWYNALFKNEEGRIIVGTKNDQVMKHWELFHTISNDFYKSYNSK